MIIKSFDTYHARNKLFKRSYKIINSVKRPEKVFYSLLYMSLMRIYLAKKYYIGTTLYKTETISSPT